MRDILRPCRLRLFLPLCALLAACGFPRTAGRHGGGQYAQAMDSATSACLRNPSCYMPPAGEEAVLPWLSRFISAARTSVAVARLLDAAELARVEQVMKDCANQASFEVNERLLGKGQRPTRKLCQETFETDGRGNKVTWAMHLGREKHQAALECVQKELGKTLSDNFSLQPHYRYERKAKKLDLLDPKQVEEWLRDGLFGMLLGSLMPDVVFHASGDPRRVQAVFDFKFPCPSSNGASWYRYPLDHPYYKSTQGDIYREAFGVEPRLISPGFGATGG
ncbi:MAG TPA: hypothetical protein VF815_32115 [Myxococcaceae bacterium]|jgi:hypothetical protein